MSAMAVEAYRIPSETNVLLLMLAFAGRDIPLRGVNVT